MTDGVTAPRLVASGGPEEARRADDGEGLSRGLSSRQIQLMAIGGAIGVGLFLGAGKAISEAGPAVLLAYLLCGAVAFLMLRVLGEMAMEHPISGSFARYSGLFVGPWAEYATGWTYWAMWITTVMAEITAIGIYVKFWVPGMPQWIPALGALIVLLAVRSDQRVALAAGAVWAILLVAGWYKTQRKPAVAAEAVAAEAVAAVPVVTD